MKVVTTDQLKIGDRVRAICPNDMTKQIYRVYRFIDGFTDRVMLKLCKKSLPIFSELRKISEDYSSEYKLSEIELLNTIYVVDNNSLYLYEDESFDDYTAKSGVFAPSISASIFESKEEALDYIKKQAEIRLIFHQEKVMLYRSVFNEINKVINELKEE